MCQTHGASGTLRVESWGLSARISFHRGEIQDAICGSLRGEAALAEVGTVRDGTFALRTAEPVDLSATAPTPRVEVRVEEPTRTIPADEPCRASRAPRPRASRPAPPPIPRRAPMHAPPARRPLVPSAAAARESHAGSGHAMPQPYAFAGANGAHAGELMPRLRLPSTAVSVGIFCATMLLSLMAVL